VVKAGGLHGHLPRPPPWQGADHGADLDPAGHSGNCGHVDCGVPHGAVPLEVVPGEEPVPAGVLCVCGQVCHGLGVVVLAEVGDVDGVLHGCSLFVGLKSWPGVGVPTTPCGIGQQFARSMLFRERE